MLSLETFSKVSQSGVQGSREVCESQLVCDFLFFDVCVSVTHNPIL